MLDRSSLPMLSPCARLSTWLTIERACFIFGVISSVLSAVLLLVLVILINVLHTRVLSLFDDHLVKVYDRGVHNDNVVQDRQERDFNLFLSFLGVSTVYIYSIISFIFSVFLCYGVHKRRSVFVKLYVVYGTLLNILMMLGSVVYVLLQNDVIDSFVVLSGCAVYTVILIMVHRTYVKIRDETDRPAPLLDSKPAIPA